MWHFVEQVNEWKTFFTTVHHPSPLLLTLTCPADWLCNNCIGKSLTWCSVLLWLFLLLALFLSHCKHLLYVPRLTVPLSPLRCPWTSAESIKHRITSTRSLTSSWQVSAWIFELLVMVNFLLKQHLQFQITLYPKYPTLSNTLLGF